MENNGKRLFEAAIISEGGLRIDATFFSESTVDAIKDIQDAFVFACGPLTAQHTCTVRPVREYMLSDKNTAQYSLAGALK